MALSPGKTSSSKMRHPESGIRMRTMEEVIRDVQARCQHYAEPGVLQSDELIRERRAEAAREANREAGTRG